MALYEGGADDVVVCSALKLSEKEFQKRMVEDEIFSRLVAIGRLHAKAWWYDLPRNNLWNRSFQAAVWKDVMRNRFGWSDGKSEVDTKPLDQKSDVERKQELESLLVQYAKRFGGEPNAEVATMIKNARFN